MASLPPALRTRRARRVAILVVVILALRVVLPFALEAGIAWGGERATGVPVSVENVDLGVLRGRIVLDGLAVAGPGHPPTAEGAVDPETAFLRWDRLDLNLAWLDLLRGRVRLSELRLAGPRSRIELDEAGNPILPTPPPEPEAADGDPAEPTADDPAERTADDPAEETTADDPAEATAEAEPAETEAEATAEAEPAETEAEATPEAEPAETEAEATAEAEPAETEAATGPGAGGAETEAETAPEPGAESEDSGWPILVDEIELLALDVRLVDGGETPAVDGGLEALRLSDIAFDATGIGLGDIDLVAPRLHVRRDFVLEPRAAPAAEEPAPEAEATADGSVYRMAKLDIDRAEFVVLTDAGPLNVALHVDATGLTTERGERFPAEVRIEIEDGMLEIAGDAGLVPPAFAGEVRWSDLPLSAIQTVARPDLAGWIVSHRASGELRVDLLGAPHAGETPGLSVSGRAATHDLLFRDPEGEALSLAWETFEVPIEELFVPLGESGPPEPVRVSLGAVRLVAPRFAYRQPSDALDILLGTEAAGDETTDPPEAGTDETEETADAAEETTDAAEETTDAAEETTDAAEETTDGAEEEAAAAPAVAEPAPGPEPVVSIASFEIVDGELDFRDASVEPAYDGRVRALDVQLQDVRLPAGTVERLALSATLPVRSRLSIAGSHGDGRSRITVGLDELALSPLDPYAADAAGYHIEEGHFSLDTEASRRGDRWDVENRLVLHQLVLSGTGTGVLEQILGIPVELAMALLRDLEGDIQLGIPVAFDRDGLQVGIGSVVRDALRSAVAGAVTSPLKMMGAAFNAAKGGIAVEPVRMQPGRTALAEGQEPEVAGLAELIVARPRLAVRLEGGATPEDRDALAETILIERVEADEDLPEVEGDGFFASRRVKGALEARGRGEPGALEGDDAALLARWIAAVEVPPERFARLARERAEALAARLVATDGVAPEQVRVAETHEADAAGVRIGFEAL